MTRRYLQKEIFLAEIFKVFFNKRLKNKSDMSSRNMRYKGNMQLWKINKINFI